MSIKLKLGSGKSGTAPSEKILADIRDVRREIDVAYSRFKIASDSDLIDAAIYDIEALNARHRYLIRLAKANSIEAKLPVASSMKGSRE